MSVARPGAFAMALLATPGVGHVELRDLVVETYPTVSAIVRVVGADGRPVPGLGSPDFTLVENGRPVVVTEVRPSFREGGSVAVVLAIDTSGSMDGGPIEHARAAARAFLARLGPDDRVAVITFGNPPQEVSPFEPPGAVRGVEDLAARGDTALYDAVNLAVARLASRPATARAVVLLTDGRDDGGVTTLDTLGPVLAGAGIPVHIVGITSYAFDDRPLRTIASLSGGSYREVGDPRELATLYREIASELQAEYRISYESVAGPGRHDLRVEAITGAAASGTFRIGPTAATATEPAASGPVPAAPIVAAALVVVAGGATAAVLLARRRGRSLHTGPGSDAAQGSVGLVLEGPGVSIPLTGGSLLLGRDPTAQVIVDDGAVSRRHARFEFADGGLWIEDLGSSNGTAVNGVPVTRTMLRIGDVVEIGDLRLELRSTSR